MNLDIVIMIFVHIILMASVATYPLISKKNIAFGIKMPLNAYDHEKVSKLRKQFMLAIVILGLVMSMMTFIFRTESYMMSSVFIALALYTMVYLLAYKKMKLIKKEEEWLETEKSTTVIDTSFRKRQLTVPAVWYLLYVLIGVMTVVIATSTYSSLPEMVAVQFNNLGEASSSMPKFKAMVYLIGIQGFTFLLMAFVQYTIKDAKQDLTSNNVKASSMQSAKFRYAISKLIFALGVVVGLAFMFAMMLTVGIITSVSLYLTLTLGSTLVVTLAIIIYSIKYGQDGNRMLKNDDDESNDFIDKEDDQYWKLGMFYYNKNDPSVFIGKRVGVGWSTNHARWQTWLFYALIIGFIIVMTQIS